MYVAGDARHRKEKLVTGRFGRTQEWRGKVVQRIR